MTNAEPTSKEGKFLKLVFDQLEIPKHPIFAIMVQQMSKLTTLVDGNEQLQGIVNRTLAFIKENWDA